MAGETFIANGNPAAQTDEATVLYDTGSGELFYDADGTVRVRQSSSPPSVARPRSDDDIIFV